ncbi:hypothetical protein BaRGS_00033900 [Batillaria attramentaria]|uniref:Uncharacterized protein n=1 Tax=Batillaria attramentaria TaxID=370345 RepID=A0ABD0JJ93_9CAEN
MGNMTHCRHSSYWEKQSSLTGHTIEIPAPQARLYTRPAPTSCIGGAELTPLRHRPPKFFFFGTGFQTFKTVISWKETKGSSRSDPWRQLRVKWQASNQPANSAAASGDRLI